MCKTSSTCDMSRLIPSVFGGCGFLLLLLQPRQHAQGSLSLEGHLATFLRETRGSLPSCKSYPYLVFNLLRNASQSESVIVIR